MTLNPNGQYRLQGWVVSALFHGLALTVALGLMAQVKPVVPKEVFQWDVALVEPQRIQETRQAEITPTQEPAKPTPRPVAPAPSKPQMITQEVQTREVTPVVQREIRQVVETSQPIEETVAVQTRTEVVSQVQEQQAVSAIVESSSSVVAQAEQMAPAESVVQESTPQVAMVTRPAPSIKVDHGWLADSLRRRLAEIKRYPSTARLNGWEGKVVLRAVIRADGHLTEVKVHRSSGYDALDNAAIEAIRLVCPLNMHQPLGTSEVAVYVPIVYSLAS
ncbi:MAG: energy transducer TonB [Nitrospira sp.]|nr:energy transducer TonB [Nitrospira sp.]